MNIFDQYLEKIKIIILNLSDKGELILPDTLEGINTELPPKKFNSDISTNVAMVLSKINKKPPMDLADDLAKLIKKRDNFIEEANIVKPGLTIDISSIKLSLSLIALAKVAAKSVGVLLFAFDKTIATFVEISLLNFEGGTSVVMPSKLSGKINSPLFDKS